MIKKNLTTITLIILSFLILSGCDDNPLNNPYSKKDADANIYYSSFNERPKTLDPARSYSSNEYQFIAQIYEPPLQYHYLKRPFELIPLSARKMPKPIYYDKTGKVLPDNAPANEVAKTIYNIQIKKGIKFQPHPAFARNNKKQFQYHTLLDKHLEAIYALKDFPKRATRELTAADFVYQIKRLAHPALNSPILSLMEVHILGLTKYSKTLQKVYRNNKIAQSETPFLDLRKYNFPGVKVINRYTYQIILKDKYPQFKYWLAMPFFSPMPWEADKFYSQKSLREKNISLDWFPVGTGPYMLTVNNPNLEMIMQRNPNYHGEKYPRRGTKEDKQKGYLKLAGQQMPFIDKFIYSLEKETIPLWNKFLQGYYDQSGVSSDSFDKAIYFDDLGSPQVTEDLRQKHIRLNTVVMPTVHYIGFNMLDRTVGGYSDKRKALRQAISIALDEEEYIAIFLNGRGIPAQGPIPPGIFGHVDGKAGVNDIVYKWDKEQLKRRALGRAKRLLREAGYPKGRSLNTGKPLVLNYDVSGGGPDDKAHFSWLRKQFNKLGIQLNVRATQYNRFQDKLRSGNIQMFSLGWHADYPDPENFLFLLYGPNGKVKHAGENATNYKNKAFDTLFKDMEHMLNSPERLAIIQKMVNIVRQDSPWVWGFHPKSFVLSHQWVQAGKPNTIAQNTMKYRKLNPVKRNELRHLWNKPTWWPVLLLLGLVILSLVPVLLHYWQKEYL